MVAQHHQGSVVAIIIPLCDSAGTEQSSAGPCILVSDILSPSVIQFFFNFFSRPCIVLTTLSLRVTEKFETLGKLVTLEIRSGR